MAGRYILTGRLAPVSGHRTDGMEALRRTTGVELPAIRVRPPNGMGSGHKALEIEATIAWLRTHLGNWTAGLEARLRAEAGTAEELTDVVSRLRTAF